MAKTSIWWLILMNSAVFSSIKHGEWMIYIPWMFEAKLVYSETITSLCGQVLRGRHADREVVLVLCSESHEESWRAGFVRFPYSQLFVSNFFAEPWAHIARNRKKTATWDALRMLLTSLEKMLWWTGRKPRMSLNDSPCARQNVDS